MQPKYSSKCQILAIVLIVIELSVVAPAEKAQVLN
jgi:hypothetical protein